MMSIAIRIVYGRKWDPQEIHEVIEKSSLVAEKVTYTYENGELIVSGRLQVNDTHCYIIRK